MRLPDAPPRQGLPKPDPAPPAVKDRPRCPTCRKRLRPDIWEKHERCGGPSEYQMVVLKRWWSGRYQGYGAFCTLTCGVRFANAAHKAGYRLKGRKR